MTVEITFPKGWNPEQNFNGIKKLMMMLGEITL